MNILIDSNNQSANAAIAEKLMESRNYILCDLSESVMKQNSEFSQFDIIVQTINSAVLIAKKKKRNILINGFIYSRIKNFSDVQRWYLESLLQPNSFIVIDTGLDADGRAVLEKSGFDIIKYDPECEFFIDLENKIKNVKIVATVINPVFDPELFGACLFRNLDRKNAKIVEIMNFGTFQISYESFVQELFNLKTKLPDGKLFNDMEEGKLIFVKKGNPVSLYLQMILNKK